jgi:ABC-type glycerol-3-phosphate transport system substrate-binding protein
MKNRLLILAMLFVLIIGLTACGGDSSLSSTSGTDTTVDNSTPAPEATEAASPTPKVSITSANFIGTWADINSPDNIAKITKVKGKLQYKDSDGAYPAKFKNGVLTITAPDNTTAEASIDQETGHLILIFGENTIEFKKK